MNLTIKDDEPEGRGVLVALLLLGLASAAWMAMGLAVGYCLWEWK